MKIDKHFVCTVFTAFALQFTFGSNKIMAKDMIKLAGKDTTCTVYEDSAFKNNITYINPLYSRDAALLNESSNGYEILVAGVRGWIKKDSTCGKTSSTYDIKDIGNQNRTVGGMTSKLDGLNVTRYQSYNNKLYFSAMVYASYEGYFMGYTDLPEGLKNDMVYYSYDGIYYYTDYQTLINDYRNNTRSNAVNAKKPYFDYYQYVSTRSKSNISAASLDAYLLKSRPDANVKISIKDTFNRCDPKETLKLTYEGYTSVLYKKGSNFNTQQDNYQLNTGALFGLALNESGYGVSRLARFYNNPFGYGAVDSCPDNATIFASINKAVSQYYSNISKTYSNPESDFGERGTQLGSKAAGMNTRYASDPLWGYKNAYNYRKLDEFAGNVDKDKVSIGILKNIGGVPGLSGTGIIRAYFSPSLDSSTAYYYTNYGASITIVGSSNNFYKVVNETGPNKGYVYVLKDNVYVVTKNQIVDEYAITTTKVDKEGATYYIWGKNSNGQLGNGNTSDVKKDNRIDVNSLLPKGEVAIDIKQDGQRNLFVLCASGNIYSSGVNDFGQRGNNSAKNKFNKLDLLGLKAKSITLKKSLLTITFRDKVREYGYFGKNALNGETGKMNKDTKTLVWVKKNSSNQIEQVRYYNMKVRKKSYIFNYKNKKIVDSSQYYYYDNKKTKTVKVRTYNTKGKVLNMVTKSYNEKGTKIGQKVKYY